MAGNFVRYRRRRVVVLAGLLLAGSATVTTGVAFAAQGERPVDVTFQNRSSTKIAACIFGSGGRCTNGGVEPGATQLVQDPFNSKREVRVSVFVAGEQKSVTW